VQRRGVSASAERRAGSAGSLKVYPRESSITRAIMQFLRSLPDCHAVKTWGGPISAGLPDILGCWRGRAFALEVKRPGGKLTPRQAAGLDTWRRAGAIAAVVRSVDDARAALGVPPAGDGAERPRASGGAYGAQPSPNQQGSGRGRRMGLGSTGG
jgi:hypothetical protein